MKSRSEPALDTQRQASSTSTPGAGHSPAPPASALGTEVPSSFRERCREMDYPEPGTDKFAYCALCFTGETEEKHQLLGYEVPESMESAIQREKAVRKWNRAWKIAWNMPETAICVQGWS